MALTLPDWLKPQASQSQQAYDDVFGIPIPGIDELPVNQPPAQSPAAPPSPPIGATRVAADGAIETWNGQQWERANVIGQPTTQTAAMPAMAPPRMSDRISGYDPAGNPIYMDAFNPYVFNAALDEQARRNAISQSTIAGYTERRNEDGTFTITGADGRQFVIDAPPESKSVNKDLGVGASTPLERYLSREIVVEPFGGVNDATRKFGPGGNPSLREIGNPYATQYQGMPYGGIVPLYAWGDAPPNTPAGVEAMRAKIAEESAHVRVPATAGAATGEYSGVPLSETTAIPEGQTGTTVTGRAGPSIADDYWENGIVPVGPDGTPLPAGTQIPPGTPITYYKMTAEELAAYRASVGLPTVGTDYSGEGAEPIPQEYLDGKGHYWDPAIQGWRNISDGQPWQPGDSGGGAPVQSTVTAPSAPAQPSQPPAPAQPQGPPPEQQIRTWLGSQVSNAGLAIPIPETTSAGTVRSQWPPEVTIYYRNENGNKVTVKELDARLEPGRQYYVEFTASEAKKFTPPNSRVGTAKDIEFIPPQGASIDLWTRAAEINQMPDHLRIPWAQTEAGRATLDQFRRAGWMVFEDGSVRSPNAGTLAGIYNESF